MVERGDDRGGGVGGGHGDSALMPPVTMHLENAGKTDIDTLALALIEQQQTAVEAKYAYCSTCAAAISITTVYRHRRIGGLPRCKRCGQLARYNAKQADKTAAFIFLCAECRLPLTGQRLSMSRFNSKRGKGTTCGASECTKASVARANAARVKPRPPCAFCGEESHTQSASRARLGYGIALCGKGECRSKAASDRQKRLIAKTGRGPGCRKIRCVDTGEIYASITEASRVHGISSPAVLVTALRRGTKCKALSWAYV